MEQTQTCVKTSCIPCGFCWKNVWYWAIALAILPAVVSGVGVLQNVVHNVVSLFVGK